MEKSPYNILGIGSPFFDRFAFVDEEFLSRCHLSKGDTTLTEEIAKLDAVWDLAENSVDHHFGKLGGSCTNVMKVLSKLGHKTALCGKVGPDETGRKLYRQLESFQIFPLLSLGKNKTGIVNCFITQDAERSMQSYLGAAVELSEGDITPKIFKTVSHLHIEGYTAIYGRCLEKSVELARAVGATISLDLASPAVAKRFNSRILAALPSIDFIFGNAREILSLQECEDLKLALANFPLKQAVVATTGALGCFVKNAGEKNPKHYDALKVLKVVDTTGAGDYFDGGFLHGALTGKNVSECVDLGNLAASFVIQQLGADLSKADWERFGVAALKKINHRVHRDHREGNKHRGSEAQR